MKALLILLVLLIGCSDEYSYEAMGRRVEQRRYEQREAYKRARIQFSEYLDVAEQFGRRQMTRDFFDDHFTIMNWAVTDANDWISTPMFAESRSHAGFNSTDSLQMLDLIAPHVFILRPFVESQHEYGYALVYIDRESAEIIYRGNPIL